LKRLMLDDDDEEDDIEQQLIRKQNADIAIDKG
jgi:hypothetical protein